MQIIANDSSVSEFLLLEFSDIWELQIIHFILFLIFYLATVMGNLLIISAVVFDHHLHSPMYFFLMNLAIFDIGSVSVIVPKSMANSLLNRRLISLSECAAQVFLYMFFAISDFSLLTVMAYDRYVAICHPLQYEMVMNRQACLEMIASVWACSLLLGVLHTIGTFANPFCSNVVNQFFCEIPQLLKLTCSDVHLIEIVVIVLATVLAFSCSIYITVTYVFIFTVLLRMPSVQGRRKAFSTCLPHIITFSTMIASGCVAYFKPPSSGSSHLDLTFAIIYSMLPPLLNPVIYSMRNNEIKLALSKLLGVKNSPRNMFFSPVDMVSKHA